ncbi:hypothetical protein PG985_003498 [Apiospora marii]|uniref:uncharacterized protein n=1 Tax=Apiospora marii TaxID=335849 RepID=UPI00312F6549
MDQVQPHSMMPDNERPRKVSDMVEDQSRLAQTVYQPKVGTARQAAAHWEAMCSDCELRLAKAENAASSLRDELGYYSMLRSVRRRRRLDGGSMDNAEYWSLRGDVDDLEARVGVLRAAYAREILTGGRAGSAELYKIALELEELGWEVSTTQAKFQTSEKS